MDTPPAAVPSPPSVLELPHAVMDAAIAAASVTASSFFFISNLLLMKNIMFFRVSCPFAEIFCAKVCLGALFRPIFLQEPKIMYKKYSKKPTIISITFLQHLSYLCKRYGDSMRNRMKREVIQDSYASCFLCSQHKKLEFLTENITNIKCDFYNNTANHGISVHCFRQSSRGGAAQRTYSSPPRVHKKRASPHNGITHHGTTPPV